MRMQLPDTSLIGRKIQLCDTGDLPPHYRNQEAEIYGFVDDDKFQVKIRLNGSEFYQIVFKDYCAFLDNPA
jgi:hypothetical protein